MNGKEGKQLTDSDTQRSRERERERESVIILIYLYGILSRAGVVAVDDTQPALYTQEK